MENLYIGKVLAILGGMRGESELEIIKDCFSSNLSPDRAAQVVINNRQKESTMIKKIVRFIILVVLIVKVINLNVISSEYFEDGSGRIIISYCIPFHLCD